MNPERNNATEEPDKMIDDEDAFDNLVKSLHIIDEADEADEMEQDEENKTKTEQLTVDLSKSMLMCGKPSSNPKSPLSPDSPIIKWGDEEESPPLAPPCLTRSKTSQ